MFVTGLALASVENKSLVLAVIDSSTLKFSVSGIDVSIRSCFWDSKRNMLNSPCHIPQKFLYGFLDQVSFI